MRCHLHLFAAAALSVFATGAMADGPISAPPLLAADYSLDEMSEEELDQLAQLVDGLAQVETVFRVCAEPQHYDRQLRERIEDCIVPESVDRVQIFFDERMRLYREGFDPAECESEALMSKLPEIEDQMQSALWRIGLMCTLCLTC